MAMSSTENGARRIATGRLECSHAVTNVESFGSWCALSVSNETMTFISEPVPFAMGEHRLVVREERVRHPLTVDLHLGFEDHVGRGLRSLRGGDARLAGAHRLDV